MGEDLFSIQIFFIIFRETLETSIIVSVLLSFINQKLDGDEGEQNVLEEGNTNSRKFMIRKLKLQVWIGAFLGFTVCLAIGLVFILFFYVFGKNFWSYTERLWEGIFSFLSSIVITVMGLGLLRINKVMKIKWWVKLGNAYNENHPKLDGNDDPSQLSNSDLNEENKYFTEKYFLAMLPFVTTLREGLEAVVFVGGIGMSTPATSLPISIILGAIFGGGIGYLLYRGGNKMSLQYFLIVSTCFLYIVSAGLMSRGVWFLELERYVRLCGGLDVSETGSGPGSYDIATSVWHVNCCNGLTDGWWMVLNALVGWTNSATYGSVIAYCIYWLAVILRLQIKLYEEKRGTFPFIPLRWQLKRIKKKLLVYETHRRLLSDLAPHEMRPDYRNIRSTLSLDLRDPETQELLSS